VDQNKLAMSYEQNFRALGSELPPKALEPTVPPGCNFVLYRQSGNLLIISGYGPFWGADLPPRFNGKLGANIPVGGPGDKISDNTGYAASRLTAINLLLVVRQAIYTLDNVVQVVEVNAFVNSTPEFTDQPTVINGCSDLLVDVFGNNGRHTRSAIGAPTLAFGICVEISMSLLIMNDKSSKSL
jgi:enamine deaminase RidA (YjgF/YER057c/UK114 family)